MRHCPASAPRATCCAPPRASSPIARTDVAKAGKEIDDLLVRFRKLPKPVRVVYARPRTFVSVALGVAAFFLAPQSLRPVTRLLIGWDTFVALYLALAFV